MAKVKLNLQFASVRVRDSLCLEPDAKILYDKYVKTLKYDKRYFISIKEEYNKRSLALNAYYWGVVIKIFCDYTGYEPEEAHEYFKLRFNSIRKFNPRTNQELPPVPKSSASLDNVEFIEYYQKIQRWCAQGGDDECSHPWHMRLEEPIYIPDPNEFDLSQYD